MIHHQVAGCLPVTSRNLVKYVTFSYEIASRKFTSLRRSFARFAQLLHGPKVENIPSLKYLGTVVVLVSLEGKVISKFYEFW